MNSFTPLSSPFACSASNRDDHLPARPKIYLYSDRGSAYTHPQKFFGQCFPDTPCNLITGRELRDDDWMSEQNGMIVLPGIKGETCPYYDQIGERGRDNLKRFLDRPDNIFMGICAGLYAIHENITYNLSSGGTKQRASSIALLQGDVYGPPDPGMSIDPQDDYMMVSVAYKPRPGEIRRTKLAHGNGPALDKGMIARQGGKILGVYDDVPGQPACGLSVPCGQGRIIGLSTLPYFEVSAPYEAGRQRYLNHMVLKEIEHAAANLHPSYFGAPPYERDQAPLYHSPAPAAK